MGQPPEYCPVSIAAEIVGERWTLLILRELFAGARGFNDIHRGLPSLSRTLLSRRLRRLRQDGLVQAITDDGVGRAGYRLTEKGEGLRSVLLELGAWSVQWNFPTPTDDQLDPHLLLWRMRSGLVREQLPNRRVIVEITFDQATNPVRAWMVLDGERSSLCTRDPLIPVDVHARASSRVWHELWYGHRTWGAAHDSGDLELGGDPALLDDVPRWFHLSVFAGQVASRS